MKKRYVVTGACGHLGSTIVRMLQRAGESVYGLVLPGEPAQDQAKIHYVRGDVRDIDTLRPLFADAEGEEIIVIHTAGIIDISEQVTDLMYAVNVGGTKNILKLCQQVGVRRLVYVSSVHAIPEKDHLSVLSEVQRFSPDWVVGGYAKTKAEATQAVLDAVAQGLDAVVVHPSGILGPYDNSGNHLVQMVKDYLTGKLPACVKGGYDFVDVRDVAYGCLTAAERGKTGECYILSNRHYEVRDVLRIARTVCGGRRLPVLPMWMAKAAAPLLGWISRRRRQRPLYTKYSLYTLSSNDRFSHDKATLELGYRPRDLCQTIRDTAAWLRQQQLILTP
ncbi:MAG: NAD-dependent epimerase/dehydratase family protein [Christensenellales bacterium]|jgi:dihydroflavonol-4-reductase